MSRYVSVLFCEPKIRKEVDESRYVSYRVGFSALLRAENSERHVGTFGRMTR